MNKSGIAVREREEYILELLKERKDEGVSGKEIASDLGVSSENRALIMRNLMKKHPQIKNISGVSKPAVYVWQELFPLAVRENEYSQDISDEIFFGKNAEGYSDPTVAAALLDDKKKDIPTPQPGEVWSTLESNGTNGKIFVMNALNGAAQCIKLYQKTTENLEIVGPDPFEVRIKSRFYVGDATHITFKPLKYCTRCDVNRDYAKLVEARKKIAAVLGIKLASDIPAPTPAQIFDEEKERLKKENKQLKAQLAEILISKHDGSEIPIGYIDMKSAEIAKLTEERDIWKSVAQALLNK
jgi:transcriptional regulator with XRE-family HTH domain